MMQVNFWCWKAYFIFRVTHDLLWKDHAIARYTEEPNIAAHGSELPCIYQLILVDNGTYTSAQAEIQWKHILTLIAKMQSNYFEMHAANTTVLYASVYNCVMSNIIENS
jgi:hypothetical protein